MMKKLLLLAAAVLLPISSVQAEGGSKGFKTGTKFKLKVAKVQSTAQVGFFGVETRSKIPKIIPKFKKGSVIRFKVARKGKLAGKGFKINFAHASKKVVEYSSSIPSIEGTLDQTAEITRKGKRAKGGLLLFSTMDFSGDEPVFYTVRYTLK